MADKLSKWEAWDWVRFQCDCYHPSHILDVSIEGDGKDDPHPVLSFSVYSSEHLPLMARLREVYKIMLGRRSTFEEIVIRPDDYAELVNLISTVVHNPNTTGN